MNQDPLVVRTESKQQEEHEFMVVFRKDALSKLRELAVFLDLPDEKLGDIIVKGIHLIDMAKYSGKVIIDNKMGRFEVDVKKL